MWFIIRKIFPQKVNIYSDDWCNLVFEDKNQKYGAYPLRQGANKRHGFALICGIAFFSLAITSPMIIKSIIPDKKEGIKDVTVISDYKIKAEKKPDEIKVEIEKPIENAVKTIEFVPPVITRDEDVTKEIVSMDKVNDDKGKISTNTQEGTIGGTIPDDIGEQKVLPPEPAPILEIAEQMPQFKGGEAELYKFLGQNFKYPEIARQTGLEGKLLVEFVVRESGKITDVKIIKGSVGGGCEEEALRVFSIMPAWAAGKQNGRAVPIRFRMPFVIKLNK